MCQRSGYRDILKEYSTHIVWFSNKVKKNRIKLVSFLNELVQKKKKIVAVSAPAKGMTLLNYCKIDRDYLAFATEKSKLKQGLFTPGTKLPIFSDIQMLKFKPDYALLLAWNFSNEIIRNNINFLKRGGKFIIPIPKLKIITYMTKNKVNEQEEFNGIDTVLTVDTTIDISELPLISLEGEVSSNPASLLIEEVTPPGSLAAITPVEERTFSFDSQSLPALKGKGKAIEGLEKYEDMIKSIATLPHTTQLESLSQFSLLKYGNYDSVKVLHKLITENEIFFRSVPDDLYDKIDPVTMAYLNKSGKFDFNREKFIGSEIVKSHNNPAIKNLFKSAYLARGIDLSKISIQELIEGLEIVLKHDEMLTDLKF
jgi:hypothetical protein